LPHGKRPPFGRATPPKPLAWHPPLAIIAPLAERVNSSQGKWWLLARGLHFPPWIIRKFLSVGRKTALALCFLRPRTIVPPPGTIFMVPPFGATIWTQSGPVFENHRRSNQRRKPQSSPNDSPSRLLVKFRGNVGGGNPCPGWLKFHSQASPPPFLAKHWEMNGPRS